MSRHQNHWYVVGSIVEALAKVLGPRALTIGIWLVLVLGFVVAFKTEALDGLLRDASSPMLVPLAIAVMVFIAVGAGVLLRLTRAAALRTAYWKSLASPTPAALIRVIEDSMRPARAVPDVDALLAHSKAIACALYGEELQANEALGAVNWKSKAPLIQAIGLSTEGIVELLCRRDARRSLELCRKARAMSSVSSALPGAAQSERYHSTCVAVCEAFLGIESAASMKALEESAADGRFPLVRVLACAGLAAAMERAGNTDRAAQLRDFLRQTAPHSAPLRAAPAEFEASAERAGRERLGPVSTSISSPDEAEPDQKRTAGRKIFKVAGLMVGLWILLLVMFVAMYALFAQPT